MSYTMDLDSDWSEPVLVLDSDQDMNLSPVILRNGSMQGLYRDNSGSNIHVVTADLWSDPATYMRHPADLVGGVSLPEDPFLYQDDAGVFHSIFHNYPWPNGPHAYSSDGWVWHKD